jgi:hypothetical protein
MRWEDERYIRVYTRDTPDWLCLSFLAQGLFCLILRKVDRAGLLKLGKHGKKAVAIVIGFPGDWSRLEPALEDLIADGCVQIRGEYLVVPNFIEAQEATQSDAQRKRESRARSRDIAAAAAVLETDKTSESVTDGHETGQKVTSGHGASQVVTPNCAVPSRTEDPIQRAPRRPVLVSPFPAGQDPYPATTAVLAALFARGIDAAPPSERQAERVEAAIAAVGVDVAAERLAPILADPNAKRPLTYHVEAIRAERPAPRRDDHARPWHLRLTPEERRQAQAELSALAAVDPDLAEAPLGITGNPSSVAYPALVDLNAKWRAIAEERA